MFCVKVSEAGDLDGAHNRCGLLLYFALFRKSAPDLPRFDVAIFQHRLNDELKNGKSTFCVSLMWHMAGAADGEPYAYDLIHPYLKSFVSGVYNDAGFLNLRRICEAYAKDHREEICPIIVTALARIAEYIAEEPTVRQWYVYDLDEFLNFLLTHCNENCVLDGVELLSGYKARIPQISGRQLLAILDKYESARARELKERYHIVLNA